MGARVNDPTIILTSKQSAGYIHAHSTEMLPCHRLYIGMHPGHDDDYETQCHPNMTANSPVIVQSFSITIMIYYAFPINCKSWQVASIVPGM
jgi:hypothetical protein